MILSDYTIKRYILDWRIKLNLPEDETLWEIIENVACSSFDMRLGNDLKIFPKNCETVLNPFEENSKVCMEEVHLENDEEIILQPWQFMLGATKEAIWLPDDLVARVEGRSSMARLGIMVHITGWFIDPGFGWESPSTITLEIKNVNTVPVVLKANMRVCQIAFEKMDCAAEIPYHKKKSAKYNGQIDPEKSRLYMDLIKNSWH